jgi:hypothetical protein
MPAPSQQQKWHSPQQYRQYPHLLVLLRGALTPTYIHFNIRNVLEDYGLKECITLPSLCNQLYHKNVHEFEDTGADFQ